MVFGTATIPHQEMRICAKPFSSPESSVSFTTLVSRRQTQRKHTEGTVHSPLARLATTRRYDSNSTQGTIPSDPIA